MTVDPPSHSAEVTDSVKFTTTVSGVKKEKFSYQWKHNGVDINGETKETLIIDDATNEFGDSDNSASELFVTGEIP